MNPYLRIGGAIAAAYIAQSRIVTSTRAKWIAAALVGLGAYLAIPLILGDDKKPKSFGRTRVELLPADDGSDCGCDG